MDPPIVHQSREEDPIGMMATQMAKLAAMYETDEDGKARQAERP